MLKTLISARSLTDIFSSIGQLAAVLPSLMKALLRGVPCLVLLAGPAVALEADVDEKAKLKACEKTVCSTILSKTERDGEVQCQLSKAWQRSKIKKGAKTKSLSWGFGDAKCTLDVAIPRRDIRAALDSGKSKLFFREHTVACQVETEDGIKPLRVTLKPTIKFKNGRAKKVRLKVGDIEGPTMLRSLIWTTVNLEKTLGIFQSEIVSEINEFIYEKCPDRHG
ncbi:MAG: hypothetical protein AAGG72_04615 [Pseudomonadota bacterium]